MSATIAVGELRERLGFTGVTVTDALEAGALRRFGPIADRAARAARAGMDLLLCSDRNVSEGESALASLERGYLHGTLNRAAFMAADDRIMALRASLQSRPGPRRLTVLAGPAGRFPVPEAGAAPSAHSLVPVPIFIRAG